MITVITPTHDRPEAWPLIQRWMRQQTVQPDQWIVVDDGQHSAPLEMGQQHLRLPNGAVGAVSLANNIMAAAEQVKGDIVLIMEDDDYYCRHHIEMSVRRLKSHQAVGCDELNYYNLSVQGWRVIRNNCSALCNTSFRASLLPQLVKAAEESLSRKTYHVDRYFWERVPRDGLHGEVSVYGIKGLPGTAGIGIGHKRNAGWTRDKGGRKLRQWLGEDADHYAKFTR